VSGGQVEACPAVEYTFPAGQCHLLTARTLAFADYGAEKRRERHREDKAARHWPALPPTAALQPDRRASGTANQFLPVEAKIFIIRCDHQSWGLVHRWLRKTIGAIPLDKSGKAATYSGAGMIYRRQVTIPANPLLISTVISTTNPTR
jgi:hypothetical protein